MKCSPAVGMGVARPGSASFLVGISSDLRKPNIRILPFLDLSGCMQYRRGRRGAHVTYWTGLDIPRSRERENCHRRVGDPAGGAVLLSGTPGTSPGMRAERN